MYATLPSLWYRGHVELFVSNSVTFISMHIYLSVTKLGRDVCLSMMGTPSLC